MKVKRYVVDSMPDAVSRIRHDLGERAVILDSKPIKQGGLWGLFGKRRLEVIAAADREPPKKREDPAPRQEADALRREVQSIKRMMEKWVSTQDSEGGQFAAVETALRKQHVADDVIRSIMTSVRPDIEKLPDVDEQIIQSAVAEEISRRFSRIVEPSRMPGDEEIIYFVGPTGVGKTTTIAKIAATHVLEHNLRVGLIAADTYRIAAVEQLKTYANILNVPLQVVHSPQEMEEARRQLADCDIVLVDTAGRNYRRKMNVSELFTYVQGDKAAVHLVLSFVMRDEEVEAVLRNIAGLPVTHVLLTKADEALSYGMSLNLACRTDYKLSFLTTGQTVPDDILPAEAETLTNLVMGVEKFV